MRVSLPRGMRLGQSQSWGCWMRKSRGWSPASAAPVAGIEVGLRHEAAFGKGVQHLPVGATGAREVEAAVRVVGDSECGDGSIVVGGAVEPAGIGAEAAGDTASEGIVGCAGRMRGPPAGGCPTYGVVRARAWDG